LALKVYASAASNLNVLMFDLSFVVGCVLGSTTTIIALGLLLFQFQITPKIVRSRKASASSASAARVCSKDPPEISECKSPPLAENCCWVTSILERCLQHASHLHKSEIIDLEEAINSRLRSLKLPDFVGPITVGALDIGSSGPALRHVQIIKNEIGHPLELECQLTYDGDAFLCLESHVAVDVPIVGLAQLPIELSLTNFRVNATARVWIVFDDHEFSLSFSLLGSPHVHFDVSSEIGYRITLNDCPHIPSLIQHHLHRALRDMVVSPNIKTIRGKFLHVHSSPESNTIHAHAS